ncbi:lymphatic vessel endothelial hyaluronic acid receptor 1 isoform X2 [Apteryx mantelli]|uniref:Lymphatic vessel endothelial hyaluronic acid receptor 1 isoform X2 n=1 Tax=Apteryx mantelli TaxID=2696672 RepID=A0A8B7JQB6_9AVES|nr:PREDICTED: lymphatic vessel endothelial hyaluronic acid receptor 1 isoform X2 [Apteryx mantelli mantelli]
MATYFGVTSAVFLVWVMTFMAQNYFITGSMLSPCRIAGIGIYLEDKVNFSDASNACSQLNLQLASKDQVEKALKHGFETCSYGWVKDGLVVIPRITSNKKCDVHINSCKPDPTTPIPPSSSEPTDLSTYSSSDLTENITAVPNATVSEQPLKNVKFRVICVTETILPTEGTTAKIPEEYSPLEFPNYTSHAAFKNDGVVFGGIPTALLVLAVIFFIISVVLAVCYIKKYKKTFPFSNKNQQKEMVETTALKEAKTNDKTPEKETKNNGKKVEESKTKPEATVKCVEAEV